MLSLPQPLMTAMEIKGSTVLAIVDNLNVLLSTFTNPLLLN
ncbi:hypothetical protein D049_0272 [Vibrio parahaemolyticus VPTS-2010]|nr:hypothetical protein D049_0272 [Vibrio parahaemolyticus VPTS-2010]